MAVVVEQRLGSPTPRSTPALALIALLGCWLVESITRVPVGVDRAGRVQFLSGVNAVLFPAALLLPPVAFLPLAVLSLAPQLTRMGVAKATGNASIRISVMSAAAATFTVVNHGPAQSSTQSWLDGRTLIALVCAGTVMLLTESVAVARIVHIVEEMSPADLPLIDATELMRDSLDVATGALICVLHGTPLALILLAPLFVGQYYALQAHATNLGGFRDPKTGLLTLAAFHDVAGAEIARVRRTQEPAALMMMDLDGLKQVNTTHGHLAGDRFIQAMAQLLESTLRAEDLIARFGGDEFCVLLLGLDQDHAEATAERIRVTAHSTFVPGVGIPLAVSIGITPVSGEDDIDTAISRADSGLRAAKRAGKDRIHIVQPTS
jgi:diguanylate cyclase (GGDEF)-like protein